MSAPQRARSRWLSLAVCVLLAAPALAACKVGGDDPLPLVTRTVTTDLTAVKVTGEDNGPPKLEVPTPFSVAATAVLPLTKGTGAAVKKGQRVTIDYVGVNGTDGRVFDQTWGKKPTSFVLDPDNTTNAKGLVSGLIGVTVGSRVLVAIPPDDAYGVKGLPAAGIGPTDTILIVVDLRSAGDVLTRATGTAVAPKAGLPTVKLDAEGKPTITLPTTAAPATLRVQPLIQGAGEPVQKGQQITVKYTGVIWPGGKVFDSTWERKTFASFDVGSGRLLAGWDEGLVGQKVGSQILLVIPPDKGYGATGRSDLGIKGTDTLVCVVDILDAA